MVLGPEELDVRAAGLETVCQDLALCSTRGARRPPGRRECRSKLAALGVRLSDTDVLVRALSGGQRQSIAIARSLSERVKLICLDEPTAALGVKQTAQVINLVRSIAARGTGVILVTHPFAPWPIVSSS